MNVGDKVRIRPSGVSILTIVSIDVDEGAAIVESAVDAPGKYPWRTRLEYLVAADSLST